MPRLFRRADFVAALRRATMIAALALLAAGPAAAAEGRPDVPPGTGLSNPTMALNLSTVIDHSPADPFVDLMKSMRPWRAVGRDADGKRIRMGWRKLDRSGHLDADGWPVSIPEGYDQIQTLWEWNRLKREGPRHAGLYVLSYEGEGRIEIGGDARVVSRQPGRITFRSGEGRSMFLRILATDPAGTGNHIRDMTLVHERDLPLFAAGAVFNPDYVALIDDARWLRFMDWNGTNGAWVRHWDERARPGGPNRGEVALEHQVHLANLAGADPWFTMPHRADDDYVRRFAEYVRDHLDPRLTARVEYSNEVWNWGFPQTRWVHDRAEAEWGREAGPDYHVKTAARMAGIWREVFAAEPHRLRTVLGSQAAWPGLSERLLEARVWRREEPETWTDPAEIFDELAITHYFGGATLRKTELRDALLAAIDDPGTDAEAWMAARLRDPDYPRSVPAIAHRWAEHARIAEAHGLGLVGYEGGQHLHHHIKRKGTTEAERQRLNRFMIGFVRSGHMADLTEESWAAWEAVSDGPFMQFGDVGRPTKWGSWFFHEALDKPTARGERLEALNAARDPWWTGPDGTPAEGGAQYLQGTATRGSEAPRIAGTAKADLLVGGPGDQTLIGGPGDDGLHGGDGADSAIFAGPQAAYEIAPETRNGAAGLRVTGPDGSDRLVGIERLVFTDGVVEVATGG